MRFLLPSLFQVIVLNNIFSSSSVIKSSINLIPEGRFKDHSQ